MKTIRTFVIVCLLLLDTGFHPLHAWEKGGLRVEVAKRITDNHDESVSWTKKHVDRNLSLQLNVTNNSMRDMPGTTVEYVVLIRKHGYSNSGSNIWRHRGSADLKPLLASEGTCITLGDFHIGGWLQGASYKNVDRLEAWKVVITRDGQKLEFISSPDFDSLDHRAKDARVPRE